MSDHLFIKTDPPRINRNGLTIWRCEKCDSEVAFRGTLTDREVNQAVILKWPKFICIPVKRTN